MSRRRRGRRRVLGPVVSLALLGLVTAGCAIPTESGPSGIAPSHVPFNLLSPVLPTTTTTQPRASSLVPVKIYLLASSGQLTGVDRVVQSPAPLASVITALLAGPSSSEVDNHMSTAIPNNVTVLSATPSAQGVVTVNFNDAFGLITGTAAEQAVSQVVATVATQVGLGTGVIFEISGQRTSVPIASGAQVPGPVYLLQFIP